MPLSRRNFLGTVGAAAATAALVRFPFAEDMGFAQETQAPRPVATERPVLLNANENPYGPPDSVRQAAVAALTRAQRYPDREANVLAERIAAHHKVPVEQVVLGCGSTEILKLAANAFVTRSRKLVMASPTFEAIGAYAAPTGPVTSVALTPDYAHDLDRMLRSASSDTGVVYICNPNNPTGGLTPRADIEQFLRKLPGSVVVVLDEAYHHFAVGQNGYASFLDQPVDDPRLIVARTFSKVYGMAGLRLGYGVTSKKVADEMRRWLLEDNINMISARCGVAALDDAEAVPNGVRRITADREEFLRQAQARGIKTIPSCTNFVMMDSRRPAEQVIRHFRDNGILIGRNFHMNTYVRISLGLPAEMSLFWKTWDAQAQVSS